METEKITKYFPLMGLAILVSGIIKLYAYYNEFGIMINEYISFSEASISFVDDLMEILILFGASVSGFILINYFIEEEVKDGENKEGSPKDKRATSHLKSLGSFLKFTPYIILIAFMIYMIKETFSLFSFEENWLNDVTYMMVVLNVSMILGCVHLMKGLERGRINKSILIIVLSYIAIYFLFNSAIEKAKEVKGFRGSVETVYVIGGIKYSTCDTIAFIGKTEKYTFWLYKNDGVRIRPINNLNEIYIKNPSLQTTPLNLNNHSINMDSSPTSLLNSTQHSLDTVNAKNSNQRSQ